MKTVPIALFLLLASSAPACTVAGEDGEDDILEEGEVTLMNPDDEGKSDTVFGKRLRYNIRGEWSWTAGDRSMVTDADVLSQTSDQVRVRGLRVAIGMPPDAEMLELSVDAESFNDLGEISTDMAFILWTADASQSYWRPTSCRQNYFERVVVDPENRELDVIARTESGDIARSFSFDECGISGTVSQVALFAFPSSGWWSLEGYYHLKIEADCGTAVCPAPRPVLMF
jgi:hypothetical protein